MIELYDRRITVEITYRDPNWKTENKKGKIELQSFTIGCNDAGIKPKIKFHWRRVPEHFCYDVDVEIANLYVSIPSIWAESLKITAGYRDIQTTFNCTIFASYQPEPGPDGKTVFRCLVANADLALFNEQSFSLSIFHGETKYTVHDVLMEMQKKFQLSDKRMRVVEEPAVDPSKALTAEAQPNPYLFKVFAPNNIQGAEYRTGYELINDVQNRLNEQFKKDNITVTTLIFNEAVVFAFLKDGQYLDVSTTDVNKNTDLLHEQIVNLSLISSASWNAGTLSVTAPWNPDIYPGTLFKINPRYYTGGETLPNIVARKLNQEEQIFWVVQQEVTFSTHDENTMSLLAVPLLRSPKANQDSQYTKENKDTTQEFITNYANMLNPTIDIVLGSVDAEVQKAKKLPSDINELTLSGIAVNDYTIVAGDKLSTVTDKQGYKALRGRMTPSEAPISFPASYTWFGLIMILTNTKYKQTRDSKYAIDLSDPDKIIAGNILVIPQNSITWKKLQTSNKAELVNAFNVFATYYENNGKTDLAKLYSGSAKLLNQGILED